MTTQTEALKLADALNELLESFEKDGKFCKSSSIRNELYDHLKQTLEESKEALAQPEQEPVAWAQFSETKNLIDLLEEPCGGYVPLYTTPPQRKPLTDEEIDEIYFKSSLEVDNRCEDIYDFAAAIEAKLKEKNT